MSVLEDEFEKRWNRNFPNTPLTRGAVGSFKIIGVDATRSQVDFYSKEAWVIIEINGATWKGRSGAHSSGPGLRRDFTKQLLAQSQGWIYIELDSTMLKDKVVLDKIHEVIQKRTLRRPLSTGVITWKEWKHLLPTAKSKAKSKVKSTLAEYTD